ncbi:MAG: DUF1254 domain-containing protein [Verrucomicrobiota bacterium]|jgi:hypothetical protein
MKVNKRLYLTGAMACAITLGLLTGCATKNDAVAQAEKTDKNRPGIAETKAIAEQGFIYGLPLVMSYAANYEFWVDRSSSQYKCPFNQINNESRVFTYKDTAVVVPNSDTPYSLACFDLRAEPFVISVPAVEKERYYSVQLTDWNTFNYGYIGSRATGNEAGDYLLAGPAWKGKTPPGIKKVFHATSQFALTIFRTQLFGPDDMPNVQKVQAGYQAVPLSTYLHQPAPPAAPALDFPPVNAGMVKTNFFQYLDFVLQFAPAGPEEKQIRAQLARIGIGAGKQFYFDALDLEHKLEVGLGMKAADKKVEERVATLGKDSNGWRVSAAQGDRNFYHGDWLLRAAAAKAGIYGNSPAEATYPLAMTDADGDKLDGSQHNYTLTFPAGQLPPVNAFWSVTMYDGKTQLLIENPIGRYLINSPMLPAMKKDADGSLTIYIQKDAPGADKESNWLPAPNGPIYLVMRLYWPKMEAPSILPPGEGTWKPPGIRKAN